MLLLDFEPTLLWLCLNHMAFSSFLILMLNNGENYFCEALSYLIKNLLNT